MNDVHKRLKANIAAWKNSQLGAVVVCQKK